MIRDQLHLHVLMIAIKIIIKEIKSVWIFEVNKYMVLGMFVHHKKALNPTRGGFSYRVFCTPTGESDAPLFHIGENTDLCDKKGIECLFEPDAIWPDLVFQQDLSRFLLQLLYQTIGGFHR